MRGILFVVVVPAGNRLICPCGGVGCPIINGDAIEMTRRGFGNWTRAGNITTTSGNNIRFDNEKKDEQGTTGVDMLL